MDFHNEYLNGVLQRKELNWFYLSIAIKNFGFTLISIFVPIYLYTLGYSIIQILFYYFLNSLYFLLLSYFGAKIVSKIGVHHSILYSTIPIIVYFLGLRVLPEYPILYYFLPLIFAMRRVVYNYSYHLCFLTYSSKKNRGKQLSFKTIFNNLIGITAPAIGGLIASIYGFNTLYLIGSIILLIGVIPLFRNKELRFKPKFNFRGLVKDVLGEDGELISFSGYGIEFEIGRILWPIFVFLIVVSVADYGILTSLTTLISLLIFYFVGVITDKYSKSRLLIIGSVLKCFSWVFRIFANTYNRILGIESYKKITDQVLHIPWDAYSYTLAQKTDSIFRFIVAREFTFNLSRIVIIPVLMLVFLINKSPFIISFIIGGIASLGYTALVKEKL
jgi:hypothetical protein